MKKLSFLLMIFALLASVLAATAQEAPKTFSDENLRIEFSPSLAVLLDVVPLDPIPYDEDMPLFAANPAGVQYVLRDYPVRIQGFSDPVIVVFQTADFEAYTDRELEFPYGYGAELDRLNTLLAAYDEDPEAFDWGPYLDMEANFEAENTLPFLPLVGASQVFRAQPQVIEFQNGRGIRYLTYYSQAVDVITEGLIRYTFQGISEDGQTYVAFNASINTNFLPTEVPADFNYDDFANNYGDYLSETALALNTQDPAAFSPSLSDLDAMIASITLKP
jgi:hypothetical protein